MNDRDLLFYLVKRVRHDVDGPQWDDTTEHQRGLMKYLQPVADLDPERFPFERKAQAVIRYAADPRNHTPKNLADTAGPHWHATGTQTPGQPPRSSQACGTHPSQFAESCCYCAGLDDQLDDQPDIHELEQQGITGRALFERVRPRTRPDRQETAS